MIWVGDFCGFGSCVVGGSRDVSFGICFFDDVSKEVVFLMGDCLVWLCNCCGIALGVSFYGRLVALRGCDSCLFTEVIVFEVSCMVFLAWEFFGACYEAA